jgi:hypothetical protein
MDFGTLLFVSLVGFLGLGLLWFRLVRPALVDFGVIRDEVSSIPARAAADYVAQPAPRHIATGWAERPFEQAEQARGVQPEQARTAAEDDRLSISDYETLDKLGALMASKALASEAAAIETFFPPVKRGGSKRYLQLRDALRAAATRHGWQAPAPVEPAPVEAARRTPIAGRELPAGAKFFDEEVAEAR